jgi:acetyl esterase/lipase
MENLLAKLPAPPIFRVQWAEDFCSLSAMRIALTVLALSLTAFADSAADFTVRKNIAYAGNTNPRQTLDLYTPKKASPNPRPLLVYIHGGGWEGGSKNDAGMLPAMITDGEFIAASIGYRLTNEANWPAQIHDCKAAIRWLRANAAENGIDATRIAVFGISAGGHLVSMLGTTGDGPKDIEGDLGAHVGVSTAVSCVINFCGPANFLTIADKGSIISVEEPGTAITKLLGGPLSQKKAEAVSASPVTYITKNDPPFLHIHGTKDNLVPYSQALEFDAALEKAGVPSTLLTGEGGPHVFFSKPLMGHMKTFLAKHLAGQSADVPEGPVAVR